METTEEKRDQRTISLEKVNQTEAELKRLVADYGNYVVTEANLKEADEIRLKFYRPRIDIQRAEKANKVIIDKLYDENKSRAAGLIQIIQPSEKAIEARISAIKATIAERERKAAEAEQNRITGHKNRIEVAKMVISKGAVADSASELEALKGILDNNFGDHDFQEFKAEAEEVLTNANNVLAQRKEFLDLKAAQVKKEEPAPEAHHPHEDAESPDTPETVREFEKKAHPEFGSRLNSFGNAMPPPSIQTRSPLPHLLQGFQEWSHGGYRFGFPKDLEEKTLDNIKNCITEIIDNMAI